MHQPRACGELDIIYQTQDHFTTFPNTGTNTEKWWRSWVRIPLKPWFFQASSFQLLKLENLLQWSFFTFIYNHSSNMNYFIYTSNHFTPHRKMWTQLIDFTLNVWLHNSSVGRTLQRYSCGSWVRILLKSWFFQASSFQLLKLENLLQWSFFTFIYDCSSNELFQIYFTSFHSSWEDIKCR